MHSYIGILRLSWKISSGFEKTWHRGGSGASARSWLQRGLFPSTLVRWVQSWSRRLAAKACKAAWVNWAVHRLMRAAATECWRRRGACRAFACARSLTKLAASSLHLPPVSMPRTMRRHRRLRMSSWVCALLSASGFGQGGSCILPGPAPWLAISGEGRNYGGVNCQLGTPPNGKAVCDHFNAAIVCSGQKLLQYT